MLNCILILEISAVFITDKKKNLTNARKILTAGNDIHLPCYHVTMVWIHFKYSEVSKSFFIGNGQGLGTDIIRMEKVTVLITASRICWCGGFILLGS